MFQDIGGSREIYMCRPWMDLEPYYQDRGIALMLHPSVIQRKREITMMTKETYTEASKVKQPFTFKYTKPSLDWYEYVNVSFTYDKYNYLVLELRYGGSWWLIGKKYIKDADKWVSEDIGKIYKPDIPRLVEWAEYDQRSILIEIRALDGCLNPISEFLKIMCTYGDKG